MRRAENVRNHRLELELVVLREAVEVGRVEVMTDNSYNA